MFPVDSKIMIIDDSNFARTVLKSGLRDLKFWKILEAESGKRAIALLQEEEQEKDPVHLIIADIHMPEMTGLELLRWIRSQEKWKAMPVIILTTAQEKGPILEAGKLGVSHYMIKPFDSETLRERITSTWEKHGQRYFIENKKSPG